MKVRTWFLILIAAVGMIRVLPAEAEEAAPGLHALFEREWDRNMRENPITASELGDHRFNDRWPDASLAAIERSHQADLQALADLAAIDRAALSAEDQVSYDLFQWQYKDALDSYRFHEYLFPFTQLGGIQTAGDLATQALRFETLQDYQDWLARLRAFGPYMDQTIALLKQGLSEKRVLPKVVAERIPQQISDNLVAAPEKSPFYAPFLKAPNFIDAAAWTKMQSDAKAGIHDVVLPAFQRLQSFFNDSYLPNTRTVLAVTSLPDGKEYYDYLVRHYTTTPMSAEQVHDLGLKKVAEIKKQMLDLIATTGFKGDFAAFLHYLRTDPSFYYKDSQDLLEAYRAEAKTIDPLLVKEFHRLPRVPWGVAVIPDIQAPNTFPAYSSEPSADGTRAAYMYVNLYKPETRPKYEIPVLTCHEGRPGHALQLSLAGEMAELPKFRRFGYYNAYGEGWALYSETLCGEMGLYDDPYKQFGALSYQMWRAVRLVVDTGIHHYGMTREQAVQMFRDNTALTEQNIGTEVDRYIVWPGQALSYMIGEIKIQELRKHGEEKLGAKFDVRGFHDEILQNGTVPLSVLETIVNNWIASQEKN